MHWIRRACLALLLLPSNLAWSGPVDCGGSPIRLALYEYGFFLDKGAGIDKDIVDELIRRSGCRFEIQILARARIWADLESGDLDMTVSGLQTPQRDQFAWFIPYLTVKNYVLVRVSAARGISGASDFLARPGLQVGVVRSFRHGDTLDHWIDVFRSAHRVQESPSPESIFLKLKEGRVDAIFAQPPVYLKYLRNLDMDGEVVVQDWAPGEKGVPGGLVLSKRRFSQAEAGRWRALVLGMKRDGTLRRIYLRYLPESEVEHMMEF